MHTYQWKDCWAFSSRQYVAT